MKRKANDQTIKESDKKHTGLIMYIDKLIHGLNQTNQNQERKILIPKSQKHK